MNLRTVLATLVLGVSLSSASEAAPLQIDFLGVDTSRAQIVTVAGVRNVTTWAGELEWAWIGGTPAGMQQNFTTYCVDLLHNLTDPQSVDIRSTSEMTTAATNGAQRAAWLFNTYAPVVAGAGGTSYMGAALQLAIWKVIYDNNYDLTVGNFRVVSASAEALAMANLYLQALAASGGTGIATWLDAPLAGQDQITYQIPEPAVLGLLLCGLLTFMMFSRRHVAALGRNPR